VLAPADIVAALSRAISAAASRGPAVFIAAKDISREW